MKEELQQKLVEMLDKMLNGIDSGVDFMSDQLPDYIQELLLWFGLINFIEFFIGLILMIAPYWFLKFTFNMLEPLNKGEEGVETWAYNRHGQLNDGGDFACGGAVVASAVSFVIGVIYINLEWLQILIAPKVWLVEYLSRLAV